MWLEKFNKIVEYILLSLRKLWKLNRNICNSWRKKPEQMLAATTSFSTSEDHCFLSYVYIIKNSIKIQLTRSPLSGTENLRKRNANKWVRN